MEIIPDEIAFKPIREFGDNKVERRGKLEGGNRADKGRVMIAEFDEFRPGRPVRPGDAGAGDHGAARGDAGFSADIRAVYEIDIRFAAPIFR